MLVFGKKVNSFSKKSTDASYGGHLLEVGLI